MWSADERFKPGHPRERDGLDQAAAVAVADGDAAAR
jgi:hypothetical protein